MCVYRLAKVQIQNIKERYMFDTQWDLSTFSIQAYSFGDITVSASPHFGSIPSWQVKPPKSIAHMVGIRLGKASKKPFSSKSGLY